MPVIGQNSERPGAAGLILPALSAPWVGIALLVILHAVGLVGMQTAHRDWFLSLTPVNLAVSAAVVVLWHPGNRLALTGWLLLWGGVGLAAELLGVHTGFPFGNYAYGETLGPKVLEVPWVIGLNWGVLVLGSGMLVRALQWHWLAKAALSALLMVALDAVLEPVAMRLDFWQWADGWPPLQNFAGWFGVALPLTAIFHRLKWPAANPVAVALLLIQFLFFCLILLLD